MTYPSELKPTLEALYRLGQRVCNETETFQPDVVIGLAHSGWMPVRVANAIWTESHSTPFPPTVRPNLGQEKHAFYAARFKPPDPAYCCGECCDSNPDRVGHYLAWIAEQRRWQEDLYAQVQAVYTGAPARILVVDDLFGANRTCYLAVGLLEAIYPAAVIRMVAGEKDLTNTLVEAWLLQFAPELGSQVAQQPLSPDSRGRYAHPLLERLKPLITGSEDIAPQSLNWRPLTPHSAAVCELRDHLPLETILSAPGWADALACDYALQRQRGDLARNAPEDIVLRWPAFQIRADERLFCQAWLNSGVTPKAIAQAYGLQPGGPKAGLKAIGNYASRRGRGRGTVYLPVESGESWINAYALPYPGWDAERHLHISGYSEFISGQLWAGAYPGYSLETQTGMLADLLKRGVRRVIDLSGPGEDIARWPYQEALQAAGQQTGVTAEYLRFPLPFRSVPTRRQMKALLQEIQSSLAAGQGIYLHAGHNLEGRAPLALACLLVQRGQPPGKALARIKTHWLRALPYLLRLPLTEAQQEFVLNWQHKRRAGKKAANAEVIDFDPNPGASVKQQAPRLVALSAGRLGLWGKPSPHKLADWRRQGLTTLVTLLSETEGASNLGQSAQRLGLEWFWFNQSNGNNLPPERRSELLGLLERVNQQLDAGAWVVLHCAAGMHRTGMAAYALLRLRGLTPAEALEIIRRARPVTYEDVGDKRLAWVEEWLAAKDEKIV